MSTFIAPVVQVTDTVAYWVPAQEIQQLLALFALGDWGNVCKEDARANDRAVQNGGRIMGEYMSMSGRAVYIVTTEDRSATYMFRMAEWESLGL